MNRIETNSFASQLYIGSLLLILYRMYVFFFCCWHEYGNISVSECSSEKFIFNKNVVHKIIKKNKIPRSSESCSKNISQQASFFHEIAAHIHK